MVRQALREDPNDRQILGALVNVTLRSKDQSLLQEVQQRLETRLGRRPTDKDVLLWRTRLLIALKSPQTAVPELETYCRTTEGNRDIVALVTLADLYRLVGDLGQSDLWIQQAQRVDPNQQTVIHARSLWLLARNRSEDLAQVSSAYISAKDQNPSIVLAAASMLSASDSPALKREGMKLFEHAVRLAPASLPARLGLAASLYQMGDAEGAEKAYRMLLRERPEDPTILNNLAWILQEHYRRYAEALELANKALDFAPTEPRLLDTRGTILLKMEGRLADARRDFEKLVALSSSDPGRQARALVQLGRVCARLNDAEGAKQYFKTALEIDQKDHVLTADERSEAMTITQSN